MLVSREITFRARHSHHGMLSEPNHGHEFTVKIVLQGEPNEEAFLVDFRAVKRTFNRLVGNKLEGKNLDDLFPYPTAEALAQYVWTQLADFFPLHAIEVREKPHSAATYFGPGGRQ